MMSAHRVREGLTTGTSGDRFRQLQAEVEYQGALNAALAGDYKRAERLLSSIPEEDRSCDHYVLWGKVRAQHGRYEDAIWCWEKALEKEPSCREAIEALRVARNVVARGKQRDNWLFGRQTVIKVGAVMLIVAMGVWALSSIMDLNRRNAALQTLAKTAEADRQAQSELEGQRRQALGDQVAAAVAALLATQDGPWSEVAVVWQPDGLRVSGKVPTDFAKQRLTALVEALSDRPIMIADGIEVTREYQVRPGDSLSSISLSVYGDDEHTQAIYAANLALLESPDLIQVGQVLVLP